VQTTTLRACQRPGCANNAKDGRSNFCCEGCKEQSLTRCVCGNLVINPRSNFCSKACFSKNMQDSRTSCVCCLAIIGWGSRRIWRKTGITPCRVARVLRKNGLAGTGVEKREAFNRRLRKRIRTSSPICRLQRNVRMRVKSALSGSRSNSTCSCTTDELKRHIESKFSKGMSWANYGEWHIDHIVPVAAFDLSNPAHRRAVNHFTNLQPLWAKQNLAKGDRYEGTLPLGV